MLNIKPHRSILKGELLERIIVRFMVQPYYWISERVERTFVFKLYTSCTVWELKNKISKALGLAPRYIEFEFPGKKILADKENGLDMQQLGLKNNDIITTRRSDFEEYIPEEPLTDPTT